MQFVKIPEQTFSMGTDDHLGFVEDFEGPKTPVHVPAFEMAETPVTNRDFAAFLQSTGYVTTAEKAGTSYVFALFIPEPERHQYEHPAGTPWWLSVPGADWSHPFGPTSALNYAYMDHPVVHVSLADALAYCEWADMALPTEAEWECAARAGSQTTYPWGDELVDMAGYHANTWQGEFPWQNDAADDYVGTAPVYNYEPNDYGLYQMIGNVWEWCRNPRAVMLETFNQESYPLTTAPTTGDYAIRGGSFLCHCSYCNRYRSAARNGAEATTTSSHLGFRCIQREA
ncbi:MAG: formylglycine-generating enzyme family protein [Aerococcus sp.]|nr:formylglycine-generating enzyme family protein [Aerococcus sp.]